MKAIKSLGQNFLTREDVAVEIVNQAKVESQDLVWEIGPGKGILTRELVKTGCRLVAFELDARLHEPLTKEFGSSIRLIGADILKTDWNAQIGEQADLIKLVSNIPYNITSPILAKLEEHHTHFASITLMVQKEVAERICANPGTKAYGLMTLKLKRVFNSRILLNVGKEYFDPIPKVDSAVIGMAPRSDFPQLPDPKAYLSLITAAFAHRRKTLRNNLGYLGDRKRLDQLQAQSGIDLDRRGESLSEEEFIHLYRFV